MSKMFEERCWILRYRISENQSGEREFYRPLGNLYFEEDGAGDFNNPWNLSNQIQRHRYLTDKYNTCL